MKNHNNPQRWLPWALAAWGGLVFLADTAAERGVAGWLGYFVLVLAAYRWLAHPWPLLLTLASTILIAAAALWSALQGEYTPADAWNRCVGIALLWTLALVLFRPRRLGLEPGQRLAELESMCKIAPVGVAILSPDLRYLFINERLAAMNGFPVAAHLGKTVRHILPEVADTIEELCQRVLATGEPLVDMEFQRPPKAGLEQVFIGSVSFYLLNNGQSPPAICAFIQDITERKRAEEALRFSEQKYRSLAVAASQIVWTANPRGEPVEPQAMWQEFTGQSWEELKGLGYMEAIHPHDRERVLQAWTQAMLNPGFYEMEHWVRRHDGVYRCLYTRGVPILNADGTVRQWIGTCTDITERKRMEEALKESETLYRTLFETCPDAMALVDKDRKIIMVNQQSRAMFGNDAGEDLRGLEGLTYIAPSDHGRVSAYFQKLLEEGGVESIEVTGLRRDGSLFPLEVRARFLKNAESVPVMMVSYGRDISARKQAEHDREVLYDQVREHREQLQLLSRRLLEAQEAERRRLARELHDEIGQVLTAVGLNLESAMTVAGAAAAPHLQESIHIVNQALQQVRELSLDLRPAMLDVLGLLATLRWYANRQALRAGFNVQVLSNLGEQRLHPDLETTCFRVVQEALTNAARHAKAKNVSVKLESIGDTLQLDIEDDGAGFDPAWQKQRAARGESFGLLGMQERVHLQSGHFELDSKPSQGTRIRVQFPLYTQASSNHQNNHHDHQGQQT